MPRPTKLNADTQAKIEQALRLGATYELAAQYGGISYNCFNEWRKRGKEELDRVEANNKASIRADELPFVEFYEATQKAESEGAMGWLAKIELAANDGNWQAAAWKLERRYPKDYGRTVVSNEHSGANGGAIETRNTNVNIPAENAHDAGNILKQLAELGAIPQEPGTSANNTSPE